MFFDIVIYQKFKGGDPYKMSNINVVISTDTYFVLTGLISVAQKIELLSPVSPARVHNQLILTRCLQVSTGVYQCTVYQCLLVSNGVYRCLPVSTSVFRCLPESTCVYQCLPVSTGVYWCLPVSTGVYRCIPVSTGVYRCLSLSTSVYRRLLMINRVL